MSKFDGIRNGDTVLVTTSHGSTVKFVAGYIGETWIDSQDRSISVSHDWVVKYGAKVEVVERADISRKMLDQYCEYDGEDMTVAEKMMRLVDDVGITERPLHKRMADYYESDELCGLNRNIRMRKIVEKFNL